MHWGRIITISRPHFWLYTTGPALLALATITDWRDISLVTVFLCFYFTLPANLLIYGVNDIFDYETDKLNPKKQDFEGLITPDKRPYVWRWIVVLNLPFLLLIPFMSIQTVLACVAFLFFSLQYSMPPIRAKEIPFIDSAFNVLYVLPAIVMYIHIHDSMLPFPFLIAAWLWVMAMHAYSAIPDIYSDKKAGMQTVATILGSTGTHLFCAVLYIFAAGIVALYAGWEFILFALPYIAMLGISYTSPSVFGVYKTTPYLNAMIGMILFFLFLL